MTGRRQWSTFEYGYLVSKEDSGRVKDAVELPPACFAWLEKCCLNDDAEYDARLLTLKTVGRVKVLQVKNYVGVIALPGGAFIEVLPKTGHDNAREQLMMMLRTLKTFRHIATTSASIKTSRMPLMDIFIHQFIQSVQAVLQQGLKRDYLRQQENLPWMKGKLRVSAQLSTNSVRRDRFQVEYDEYSVDRPENRILKTAIDTVSRLTRNPQLIQQLRPLQSAFEGIPPVVDTAHAFDLVRLDRHMHHYEQALEWAKLILHGESPLCMQGHADAISLLFPMEAVFESFVAAWMRHHHHQRYQIDTQAKTHTLARYHTRYMFRLKPDIWLHPYNTSKHSSIICDTKWKKIKPHKPGFNISQSDLYQMLAYGTKYLDSRGDMILIYPQHDGFSDALPHPFELHKPDSHALRLWIVPFTIGTSIQSSILHLPESLKLRN
ncbi:McrC family protein [Enterobacter hormaechei]|uniref:McrC family protein n=1 Tax=Enterobacter hormaechei TaxID=158836 RepID=UPI0005DC5B56|nr:restriction endonuclease [Enterobacter hormaechei]EKK5518277.1 restriction endonuclease [Enterobacter hormaechei]EKK5519339.1 restriction endonuclease [Enterobacter hormaechei]MBF4153757.1 restriction endonuclease [Enterobacter hormaechei]RTP03018.1 restriction endonuclease [Enterobacter hormaechei]CQR79055.1 5-methylcytosine-specific restriction enzyme subunit McrC [Enterobacter hormaechei]